MPPSGSYDAPEIHGFQESTSAVDWWKFTASAAIGIVAFLAGIVLAGCGFWFLGAKDFVNREEVSAMISKEGPYIEDKKLLHDTLQQNTSAISKLADSVGMLAREQSRCVGIIERMDRPK